MCPSLDCLENHNHSEQKEWDKTYPDILTRHMTKISPSTFVRFSSYCRFPFHCCFPSHRRYKIRPILSFPFILSHHFHSFLYQDKNNTCSFPTTTFSQKKKSLFRGKKGCVGMAIELVVEVVVEQVELAGCITNCTCCAHATSYIPRISHSLLLSPRRRTFGLPSFHVKV